MDADTHSRGFNRQNSNNRFQLGLDDGSWRGDVLTTIVYDYSSPRRDTSANFCGKKSLKNVYDFPSLQSIAEENHGSASF